MIHRLSTGFILPAMLLFACTKAVPKPDFKSRTVKDADSGGKSEKLVAEPVKEPGIQAPVVMSNPTPKPDPGTKTPDPAINSKSSFQLADGKALKLGPKALPNCAEEKDAEASDIGNYASFEVKEDDTTVTISIAGFCGDLSKDNIVSIRGEDGKIIASKSLPAQEIKSSSVLMKQTGLAKGKYSIAIEAGGTTLKTLSSFVISAVTVESEKDISFIAATDY